MPRVPRAGMEYRFGVVKEIERKVCVVCVYLHGGDACFEQRASDVSRAFQIGRGVARLEWSPLYPYPSSASIFPGRGADLLWLPSHPSEPATLAALTPETTLAPGAPKCFQVALTLPTGEEPPCSCSIDVVNYPSNSQKSIVHKMMLRQTGTFTSFLF